MKTITLSEEPSADVDRSTWRQIHCFDCCVPNQKTECTDENSDSSDESSGECCTKETVYYTKHSPLVKQIIRAVSIFIAIFYKHVVTFLE